MPTPHVNEWKKITPFGSYTDPEQNHKENVRNTEQYNLVRRVRKLFPFRKHVGSKSIHSLRMYK